MKANLVCEGGGMKGIALIGAICYLEEHGYTWKNIAGTSVGALIGSLIAVGYSSLEIKNILLTINFKIFTHKTRVQSIPILGQPLGILFQKGLHSPDSIENFLTVLFKAHNKVKFKDISSNGVSKLKVIASDITRKELLILPDDLIKYNINPMEFEIAKAIRMSLSIPFYYTPTVLKEKNQTFHIVDGGLLSNFPVWMFDNPGVPECPTFGLKLVDKIETDYSNKKSNIISYISDLIETLLFENEESYLINKDSIRTIKIPTLGVSVTDFNLPRDKILKLFNIGYNTAQSFMSTWNFDTYRNMYRKDF